MRSDCDVELQCCLNILIGNNAFIHAAVLRPHRTPNCDAASSDLHTFGHEPIVSECKHKTTLKDDVVHHFRQILQVSHYFDQECLNLVPAVWRLWFDATEGVTTSCTGDVGCFSLYMCTWEKKNCTSVVCLCA